MNVDARVIAEKVFQFYDTLPRRGKPCDPRQWTTLASFLLVSDCDAKVVSCATGTRCLGGSLLNKHGHRLHDSHAEVLARRAFQRFLMSEASRVYQHLSSPDSVLELCAEGNKLQLKDDVKVILFSTQTPCGDASIYTRPDGDVHASKKRNMSLESDHFTKKTKSDINFGSDNDGKSTAGARWQPPEDGDLYRTGAKCVPGVEQDELSPGLGYHVTGVLRTKPGRGDQTKSLSCSDKISRWNILGCQGCFSMLFLDKPIYIDHIVLSGCSYDQDALRRAIYGRLSADISADNQVYTLHCPEISHSDIMFRHSKSSIEQLLGGSSKIIPCPMSLIWYKQAEDGVTEVAVNGYKQGMTKTLLTTPAARLSICRSSMLKELHRIFGCMDETRRLALLDRRNLPRNYLECKSLTGYSVYWNHLTKSHKQFTVWPRKELTYSSFTLEDA